jgi:hypothetical protein
MSLRKRRDQTTQQRMSYYCNDHATRLPRTETEKRRNNRLNLNLRIPPLLRRLLFCLAGVSVVLNKFALCLDFMNHYSIITYFWLPSVFIYDVAFLGVVYGGFFFRTPCRVLVVLFTTILVLFTAIVVAFQVTALVGFHGATIPWNLSFWAIMEWAHFKILVKAKSTEAWLQVWMVALIQVLWTLILTFMFLRINFLSSLVVAFRSTDSVDGTRTRNSRNGKRPSARLWCSLVLLCYMSLVLTVRPQEPYQKLSQTPCFSVPVEILKGIHDYRMHVKMTTKHQHDRSGFQHQQKVLPKTTLDDDNKTDFEPLNVIILFMESVRADMMPFDPSTEWARRFVPDPDVWQKITPFYSNYTKYNDTLFIPEIKSASGLTHKSLLSTLCSMHALVIQGTVEPFENLYHECMPQILAQHHYNYTSIFAQPQTENFEHQPELIRKMGFDTFFGKESYDSMTQPSDDFVKRHTANYFGYEDNIMLPILLNWMNQQRQQPFLLSYLCGITHDPHNIPPVINWTIRQYSPDERVNQYLNTVAYMDQWLQQFMSELEKQHLLESSLVVVLGDHGGSFYDRSYSNFGAFDIKYEEAMNVGVSFFSRSERWRSMLKQRRANLVDDAQENYYSSIDVVPTILQVLGIGSSALRNGQYNNSVVDGRSMLAPSGQRLRLSIPNPGYTMVLRDRSYVLIRRLYDTPEAFDLMVDPLQTHPLYIQPGMTAVAANMTNATDGEYLTSWGIKAVTFLEYVDQDLHYSYEIGQRCQNCTLTHLLSLETLDEWSPDMATSRRYHDSMFGDDAYYYQEQWDSGGSESYDGKEESDYGEGKSELKRDRIIGLVNSESYDGHEESDYGEGNTN